MPDLTSPDQDCWTFFLVPERNNRNYFGLNLKDSTSEMSFKYLFSNNQIKTEFKGF